MIKLERKIQREKKKKTGVCVRERDRKKERDEQLTEKQPEKRGHSYMYVHTQIDTYRKESRQTTCK